MPSNYRKEIKVECTNAFPGAQSTWGLINSEFAALISIFFIGPHAILPRDPRLVKSDGGTKTRGSANVPYRSVPHSACIIRTWATRIHSCPTSLRPLIHSFTLFLPVPALNLYTGAYLARFLPVIDAHSIRLRTQLNLPGAVFVLNYFARRGTEKERWRMGGWGSGCRARDSLVFIRGRRTN